MANRRMISMIPIAASSRRILKFLLIAVSSTAIAEHHRAEERVERNRRGEALVHAVLHALLHVRHGLFALEAEAEFLERNVREVEDLRAAQLTVALALRLRDKGRSRSSCTRAVPPVRHTSRRRSRRRPAPFRSPACRRRRRPCSGRSAWCRRADRRHRTARRAVRALPRPG